MNKEQVYDNEIFPLMTQITKICQAKGIAMIASFSIPTDETPDLACSTLIPDETGKNGPSHKKAFHILSNTYDESSPPMHIRIDSENETTLVAVI